jgi:amino acid adenylation domain-containing protein
VTFPHIFGKQAAQTPEAIAVRYEGMTMTYRELDFRSNQLARELADRGVGPEKTVGILLPRCPEVVVAILAVMKAGGAFVPLDPRMPTDRIRLVLRDATVGVTVTHPDQRERLDLSVDAVVYPSDSGGVSGTPYEAIVTASHAAYVIYTSGSTGQPKGATIEHGNLSAYTSAILERLGIRGGLVFGHISTFAADLGHTSLFPALASGGSVNIIASERQADPLALAEYLTRHPVDVLKIVPSHLSALLSGGPSVLPRKILVLGGEALTWELVDRVVAFSPTCEIFNHYGPTETTVGVICGRVPSDRSSRTVPLGSPLNHATIALRTPSGEPGESGEIVVSGEAVGRGYWRRADLTAERFVDGAYLTGDLARRSVDGIEFLGRADDQLKVRGHRVEPGEVRAAISRLGIENAVVAREDERGKHLVAYLVRPNLPIATVEQRLRVELPDFMIPSAFVTIDSLPITPNGKLDRNALPAPAHPTLQNRDLPSDPLTRELAAIWRRHLGRPVGIRDDFFELGGHSLIAAQIAVEASRFGFPMQPTLLLTCPTIEKLARALRHGSEFSPLVPIQPHGTRPPLFCLHAGMGLVMFYYDLTRVLGPLQPVYAFQPRALYDDSPPNVSLEAMAADYIREIRRVQPHGPYSLVGFCFGALTAFEMAQQLQADGEEVRNLIAIEGGLDLRTIFVDPHWAARQLRELRQIRTAGTVLMKKVRRRAEEWSTRLHEMTSFEVGELYRKAGYSIPKRLRAAYAQANHDRITRLYRPQPLSGRLQLYVSKGEFQDPGLGWQRVVERVELTEVPRDRENYRMPFWIALAKGLKMDAETGRYAASDIGGLRGRTVEVASVSRGTAVLRGRALSPSGAPGRDGSTGTSR